MSGWDLWASRGAISCYVMTFRLMQSRNTLKINIYAAKYRRVEHTSSGLKSVASADSATSALG